MVSKSSKTRTIRLQNDLWEWLEAEAGRCGVSVNGLVSTLLEVGRVGGVTRIAEPTAEAHQVAETRWRPKPLDVATAKQLRAAADAILDAPPRFPKAAPGSRLKGSKK